LNSARGFPRERVRSRALPVADEASVTKRSARFVMSFVYGAKSENFTIYEVNYFTSSISLRSFFKALFFDWRVLFCYGVICILCDNITEKHKKLW